MSNPRPHRERLDRIRVKAKYQTLEDAQSAAWPKCACGAAAVAFADKPYCAGCLPPEK
jgi:hypothetical protein